MSELIAEGIVVAQSGNKTVYIGFVNIFASRLHIRTIGVKSSRQIFHFRFSSLHQNPEGLLRCFQFISYFRFLLICVLNTK